MQTLHGSVISNSELWVRNACAFYFARASGLRVSRHLYGAGIGSGAAWHDCSKLRVSLCLGCM